MQGGESGACAQRAPGALTADASYGSKKCFPSGPVEQQHPSREGAPTAQQRAPGSQIGTLRSHEGRNKGSGEVPARQSSGLGTREPGGRTSVFQACRVSWPG